MPRRTYVFAHDDGRVSKRTSDREYTHAVVGRRNLDAQRHAIEEGRKAFRYGWELARRQATAGVGKPWREPSWGRQYLVTPHDLRVALELLEKYPTADDYATACVAAQFGALGEGDAGAEEVLQWSASERAARDALGRYLARYKGVRVVEVQPL
jgi:hypothetical protein